MSDLISRGKDQFHMLDTTYTFFFRFLFPHLRSNQIIHDTYIRERERAFPSSIYLCNHSSIFIYYPSISPSDDEDDDAKRLDVGVGVHYTIADPTIASK